jgi:hypothetical protein
VLCDEYEPSCPLVLECDFGEPGSELVADEFVRSRTNMGEVSGNYSWKSKYLLLFVVREDLGQLNIHPLELDYF